MADPIAEAFVRLRADDTGLRADMQQSIHRALAGTTLPRGTQRGLAQQMFGTGFTNEFGRVIVGAPRTTTVPDAAQRTLANQLFGPGFRNETGRAIQGALAGVGGGQIAARFAFFGPGGAALAVFGGALVAATASAARFERSIDVLGEVTGASEDDLRQLAAEAERLGASIELPAVTAQTAADAMVELSKAGLSVRDVLGGVEGVLQLATAANIDAGTAARISASALNAFSLEGREAVRVADLLAGASIAAQGDIGDMALALQQSAAVADQAGLKVEELVGFITLLAKQGLLGSDAGTSIRTALLRLVPTTQEATDVMESLGIQLDRTRTLGEQLPDLLDQYQVALGALNPTLRQSTLQQISGTDAIRALTVAIEAGGEGFRQATLEADRQNAALDLAQAQTRGLTGEFQGLISSTQTLGVSLGQDLAPAASASVGALREFVNVIIEGDAAIDRFTASIGDFLDPLERARQGVEEFAASVLLSDPLSEKLFGKPGDAEKEVLEDIRNTGVFLAAALDEAVQLRAALAQIGLPTDDVDRQIAALRDKLQSLREDTDTDIGLDLATPLQKAIANAEKLKEALQAQELPVEAIQAQIDLLTNDLKRGIIVASRQSADETAARNQLGRALGLSASDIARLTSTVTTEGRAAGIALGRSLVDGMVGEITAEEQRAINAARGTLNAIREDGERQVLESIRSARTNLESLGDTLANALGEIIDAGPIGAQIDELNRELDALEERTSRRQLRFDTRQAQRDLREAQEAIAQVGELTPEQKRSQKEFLEPFTEKAAEAKAKLKAFTLEEAIEAQQDLRDAAVEAAEEGLQVLIDDFETGQISAGEFTTVLRQQLGPALDTIERENLGLSFERGFLRDVQALVEQVKELAPFIGTPGTTPGVTTVSPAATQQEVNRAIADAQIRLAQAIEDANEFTKEEGEKLDRQIALLRRLVELAGGRPKQTSMDRQTVRGGG